MSTVKWFDLSSCGAHLQVFPRSQFRDTTISCLAIVDRAKFDAALSTEASEDFTKTFGALGFTSRRFTNAPPNNTLGVEAGHSVLYLFTEKSQFSLRELKTLFPSLNASCVVDVDRESILVMQPVEIAMAAHWKEFADDVLAHEGKGVWVPIQSPFDKSYADSDTVGGFVATNREYVHPVLGGSNLTQSRYFVSTLERNFYRANSLVSYYLDKDKALADGWMSVELQQVDLPYALPFHVTDRECITAVKDIRYVPELMDVGPAFYYRETEDNGKIRIARDYFAALDELRVSMKECAATIEALEANNESDPKEFHAVLGQVYQLVSAFSYHDKSRPYQSNLPYVVDNASPRGFAVAPMADIKEASLLRFQQVFKDVLGLHDEKAVKLGQAMLDLLARARVHEVKRADELAKEELAKIAQKQRDAEQKASDEAATKHKHVDVGEKIGGARKDYGKRAMITDDLMVMNSLELKAYVTKQNIWPPLNYSALREQGVSPDVALALKTLKDELDTIPNTRWYQIKDSEECLKRACDDYVKAVSLARDTLSNVKTLDDMKKAVRTLFVMGSEYEEGQRSVSIYGGTYLQAQWGRDFSHAIADCSYTYEEGSLPRKIARVIERKMNRFNRDYTPWTDEQRWGVLIKPTKVRVDAQVEAERKKKELDRELHCPHLEHIKRDGTDWRQGRDVTGEDLLEHFGFRAIEHGLWTDQKERQQVLNMAYDSFCDLAEALRLPPKELSLGGELALAFGARGTGGKNAALAHFEPTRFVINLTRMHGAGSLAHEWFHAFDWYSAGKTSFACERVNAETGPWGSLMKIMLKRPVEHDELVASNLKDLNQSMKYTSSWFQRFDQEKLDRVFQDAVKKVSATLMETIVARLKNDNFNATANNGFVTFEERYAAKDELMTAIRMAAEPQRAFVKKVRESIDGNLHWLMERLAVNLTLQVAKDVGVALPESFYRGKHEKDSVFVTNAKALDEMRSTPYWQTKRELFARSGAAFVFDKVHVDGRRSDYLVHGAEEDRYASPGFPGNPYPTGDGRRALNLAFDGLFNEFRLQCLRRAEAEVGVTMAM